jgi:hypothetical protein
MTRLLLTLLALLTGLTSVATPASARVCAVGGAEIGALEAPLGAVRIAIPGQQVNGPRARQGTLAVNRNCRKSTRPVIYLPTVQLGVDRALE